MSFVSPEFALLALLFFPLYWRLADRPVWQRRSLIASGYALYASWSLGFAALLALYSLCIWGLGRWIAEQAHPGAAEAPPTRRRLALSLGLVACVAFLIGVKYYEFLREGLAGLLAGVGLGLPLPILDVAAPVGVSFFTFQAITYLVSMAKPGAVARPLESVLLFLCFWPTLFAGPILRAPFFFEQLDAGQTGRPQQPWRALVLIVFGAAQKLVASAWLAESLVDPVFRYPENHSGLGVAAGVWAYTLQIFLDFGGYTLIVTGLALLLGYELPPNFRQPYLARNLQEFWQRWHISLSTFIRDHIYIPLGGNRAGFARTQVNLLLAMLISGAWHGASGTFIVWGALHGLGTVGLNLARRAGLRPLAPAAAHALTLGFVALAWLFFRADSLEHAGRLLSRLPLGWEDGSCGSCATGATALPLGKLLLFSLGFFWLSQRAAALEAGAVARLQALGPRRAALVLALAMSAVIALGPDGVPGFIYYRF